MKLYRLDDEARQTLLLCMEAFKKAAFLHPSKKIVLDRALINLQTPYMEFDEQDDDNARNRIISQEDYNRFRQVLLAAVGSAPNDEAKAAITNIIDNFRQTFK